jgi:4-hydroxy-3-polyprenylbenzoate decarboxylase
VKNSEEFDNVKIIVVVDHFVDVDDVETAVWIFANNIEPLRDCRIIKSTENLCSCLVIDGTTKTEEKDHFTRQWPDVVVADEETILRVDKKWTTYNIGEFIESPSRKFSYLSKSQTAVVNNKK